VDRWQVEDLEAVLCELRYHLGDAGEPAPRAGEQLVPRPGARSLALDLDLERG
jgi:hypothetical protein